MVVIMKKDASEQEVEAVITNLNAFGFDVHQSSGVNQVVLGAIGVRPGFDHRIIRGLHGVADVQRVTEPYKLASRVGRYAPTVINVDGVEIGGKAITIMACLRAFEGTKHIEDATAQVASSGGSLLQASLQQRGASLYEHHLLDLDDLDRIRQASDQHQLKLVIEVNCADGVEATSEFGDILLVDARNMQNFELLKALGESNRPVLLERGMAATVEEWLMAAEYIMRSGNIDVILCERGIRTFESATRYTLDLSAVSVIKTKSHLPIFVDPCQATGIRNYVNSLSLAAVAAGADGVVVDVHHDPSSASPNGLQTLDFSQFSNLANQIREVASVVGQE